MRSSCSLLFSRLNKPRSQPVFVGEVLQPPDHHGPPLDLLQNLFIFPVLGAPDLDEILQMGPHEGRVEMDNPPHLLPASHPSFAAAKDTIGLLGFKNTLLAHVKFISYQET